MSSITRRRWIALAIGAVFVATACGPAGSPHLAADVSRMVSSTGQQELLLTPRKPPRGLVVFMHGLGSTEDELLVDSGLFPVRDALLDGGYAIVTSDAHGNNMGNPASVQDQVNALSDAAVDLELHLPVDVLAFSMGGADALLAASEHVLPGLRAIALLSPLCDQVAFLTSPYRGDIREAFGDPSDDQLANILAISDPIRKPASSYAGYSYHFWQSPSDQVVPASQSARMVALLKAGGVDATESPLEGDHGNLSLLNPSDVLKQFSSPLVG